MNKITLAIVLSLASLSGLFGYLSYSYSEQIGVLEQKLTTCSKNNKALVLDVENASKACSITDVVVKENTEEQNELDVKKEGVIKQLDALTSKSIVQQIKRIPDEQENVKQRSVVDIDDSLPDELVRLLQQSYRDSVQE